MTANSENWDPAQLREARRRRLEEYLQLVIAHFGRSDPGGDGRSALRVRYPNAPIEMVNSAAHHVYVDGCEAALAFIAEAEAFLSDPRTKKPPNLGTTSELLYHVYNWHQFQELLPDAKPNMIQLLKEMREAVAEHDNDWLIRAVAQLEEILEAHQSSPDFKEGP